MSQRRYITNVCVCFSLLSRLFLFKPFLYIYIKLNSPYRYENDNYKELCDPYEKVINFVFDLTASMDYSEGILFAGLYYLFINIYLKSCLCVYLFGKTSANIVIHACMWGSGDGYVFP